VPSSSLCRAARSPQMATLVNPLNSSVLDCHPKVRVTKRNANQLIELMFLGNLMISDICVIEKTRTSSLSSAGCLE